MPRVPLSPRLIAAAGQLLLGLLADLAAIAAGRAVSKDEPPTRH